MLEIVGRSTGSKERKLKFYCSVGIFFPPQHCDQRLNKSLLCKDKDCVEKMNETYSMKCGRNILLLPELGFQIEQRYKSRHAGLILFGFLLSFILCPNWQSENWSGWIIWCFGNEGEKKKKEVLLNQHVATFLLRLIWTALKRGQTLLTSHSSRVLYRDNIIMGNNI